MNVLFKTPIDFVVDEVGVLGTVHTDTQSQFLIMRFEKFEQCHLHSCYNKQLATFTCDCISPLSAAFMYHSKAFTASCSTPLP